MTRFYIETKVGVREVQQFPYYTMELEPKFNAGTKCSISYSCLHSDILKRMDRFTKETYGHAFYFEVTVGSIIDLTVNSDDVLIFDGLYKAMINRKNVIQLWTEKE